MLCLFKCFNLLIPPVPANCKLLLRQDLLNSFGGSLMLVTSHRNFEALMNWVDLLFVFFRHVLIKPLGLESQQPAQYNWNHTSPVENSLQTRGILHKHHTALEDNIQLLHSIIGHSLSTRTRWTLDCSAAFLAPLLPNGTFNILLTSVFACSLFSHL